MIYKEDLAWAAGFFDGEGTSGFYQNNLRISITQNNREVLDKFKNIVECGYVRGPYEIEGKNPSYCFQIARNLHVKQTMEALWPWLGSLKRDQYRRVIEKYELSQSLKILPKVVEAFGETKTFAEWIEDPRCIVTKWNTLYSRLIRGDWDVEKALITPVRTIKLTD